METSSPAAAACASMKPETDSSPALAAVKADPDCSEPAGSSPAKCGAASPRCASLPTEAAAPAATSTPESSETVATPAGPAAEGTGPCGAPESAGAGHARAGEGSTLHVARSTCLSILNALSLCCPEWKKKDNFRSFYFHFAQISQAADRAFLDVYLTIVFDKVIRSLPPQPCPPPMPLVVKALRELPQSDVDEITAELDALRLSSAAAAAQAAATSGAGLGFEASSVSLTALAEERPFQAPTAFSPKQKEDAGRLASPRKAAAPGDSQAALSPPRGRGGSRGGLGRGGAGGRNQRGAAHAGAADETVSGLDLEEPPEGAASANGPAGPGGATPQALRRLVGGISFNRSGNAWVASWVTRADFKHRYKYFKTADFGYEQARLLAIRFRQHKLLSGDAVVEASELQQRLPHGVHAGAFAPYGSPGVSAEAENPEASEAVEGERGEEGLERGEDGVEGGPAGGLRASSGLRGALGDVSGLGGLGLETRGLEASRPRGGANFRATEPSPMEGVYYREGGSGGTSSASWQCRWSVGGKKYSKTFAVSKYGPEKARELAIRFRLQQAEALLAQGHENYNRSLEMVISEGDQNPVVFERDSGPADQAEARPAGPARATPVPLSWSDSGGPDEGVEGALSDGNLGGRRGLGARASSQGGGSAGEEPQPGAGAWQAGVKFDETTNSWKAWWRQSGGRAVFKAYPIARYGEAVAREKAETAMRAKALELQVMGGDVPRSVAVETRDSARVFTSGRGRGRASPFAQSFAGSQSAPPGLAPTTPEGRGPAPLYQARRPEDAGASVSPSRRATGPSSGSSLALFFARGAGGVVLPGEPDLEEHELQGILELDKRVPGSVFLQQSAYCLSFGGGKWVASWGVGGSDRLLSRSFSVSRFGFAQARAMAEHWRRTKLLKLWRTEQERKETASREALMMVAAGGSRLGKDRGGASLASGRAGAGPAKKGEAGLHLGALPSHRHTPYSHSLSVGKRSGASNAGAGGAVGTTSSALHHFLKLSQNRLAGGSHDTWGAPAKGAGHCGKAQDLSPGGCALASLEGDPAGPEGGDLEGSGPEGSGASGLSPYASGLSGFPDEGEEGAEEGLGAFEGETLSRLPHSRAAAGLHAKREKNEDRLYALDEEELGPGVAGASSIDLSYDSQTQRWNVEMLNLRGEKVMKSFSAVTLGGVEAARRSAIATQRDMETDLVREYLEPDKGAVHLGVSFDRKHVTWRLQPAVVVEAVLKKLRAEPEEPRWETGPSADPAAEAGQPEAKEEADAQDTRATREKKPRLAGQLAAPDKIATVAARPVEIFAVSELGWEGARAAALKASRDLQLELGVVEASLPPVEDVFVHPGLSRLLSAYLRKSTRGRLAAAPGAFDIGDSLRNSSSSQSVGLVDAAPTLGARSRRGWSPAGPGARRKEASPQDASEGSREAEQAAAAAMQAAAAAGVRCLQVSDFLADVEISPMDAQAAAQRRAALAANAAAATEAVAAEVAAGQGADDEGPERKEEARRLGDLGALGLTNAKGIHYSKRERAWVCRWTDAVTGKVAVKAFQEKKFGFEEARRLAEIYRRAAEATGRVKTREGPATLAGLPLVRFVQTRGADKARGGVWRVEWLLSEPEGGDSGDGVSEPGRRPRRGVTLQVVKPFLCHQFGIETGRLLALHLKKKLDDVYRPLAEKLRRRRAASEPGARAGNAEGASEKQGDAKMHEGEPAEGEGMSSGPSSGETSQAKPPAPGFFFDPSELDFEDICFQFQEVQKLLHETAELEARVHHALLTNAPLPFIIEPPPSPPSIFTSESGLLAGALGARDGDAPLVSLEVLALAAASGRGGRGSRGGRLSTGSAGSLAAEEGRRRRKRDPNAEAGASEGMKPESDDETAKRKRRLVTGRRGGRESAAARLAAVAADLISTTAAAQASLAADKLQGQRDGPPHGARGPGRGSSGAQRDREESADRDDSSSDSSSDSSDSDSSSESSSSSDSLSSEDNASGPATGDRGGGGQNHEEKPELPALAASPSVAASSPTSASPREGLAKGRRGGSRRRPRQGPGDGGRGGRAGAGRGEPKPTPEVGPARGARLGPRGGSEGAPPGGPGASLAFRPPAERGQATSAESLVSPRKDSGATSVPRALSPAGQPQTPEPGAPPAQGLLQSGVVGLPPGAHTPLLNPAAASALNLVLQRRAQGTPLSPSSQQAMTALVASALAAAASRGGAPAPAGPAAQGPPAGLPGASSSVGLSSSPLLARFAQNPQQQACLAAAAAAFQRQQELQRQMQQRALLASASREGEAAATGPAPARGLLTTSSPSLSPALSAASPETLSALRAKQALAHFQQQLRQGLHLQQGLEAQGFRASQGPPVGAEGAVGGPDPDGEAGPPAGARARLPPLSISGGSLGGRGSPGPNVMAGERAPFLLPGSLENRPHLQQRLQQEQLLAAAAAASSAVRNAGGVGLAGPGPLRGADGSVFFAGAAHPTSHCLPGGPSGQAAAQLQSLRFQQQVAAAQQQQQKLQQQQGQ
ncbi:UNVERIFIED_CONTAM: AP2 domain transcription factor AP2VIII-2 [Hammondia hammondi]|eukprot:XP_008882793.1 AP2 domain transcription factor AP2VIII-2 [Hammondia hammondi]